MEKDKRKITEDAISTLLTNWFENRDKNMAALMKKYIQKCSKDLAKKYFKTERKIKENKEKVKPETPENKTEKVATVALVPAKKKLVKSKKTTVKAKDIKNEKTASRTTPKKAAKTAAKKVISGQRRGRPAKK